MAADSACSRHFKLRTKDLDFSAGEITVRRGKGVKDRVTMLADSVQQ
jgi:hypothetical protein